MPEYNILVEDRLYKVELAKKDDEGLFETKVNDKQVEVKLEKSETAVISPLTLKVAGKTYQIELEKLDRHTPFTLKVNNALFKVQLKEPAKRMAAQVPTLKVVTKAQRRQGTVAEEGAVVAPMAGKIVSVKVKKGDTIKMGDVVCILEAMKMENEITATKTGKVQEVDVIEGTPVTGGEVLVLIK